MDPRFSSTEIPRFWRGVAKLKDRNRDDRLVFGAFDTETYFGRVFALGFYDGKTMDIQYGDKIDHVPHLIDSIFALDKGHRSTVVIGAHYLVFDLGVLFWPYLNPTGESINNAPRNSHFSLIDGQTEVFISWSKPCFAKLRRGKRTAIIIDTFAFFTMGLDKALKMVGAESKKLPKPAGLGERLIPRKEITPYLENDTKGVYELLDEIGRLHEVYGVSLCFSLPMMAGKVFRTKYLKKNFPIPHSLLRLAALDSYHGGKNTFNGKAGRYDKCYDLDINSAYPEAMRQLPDFENGKWERGDGLAFFKAHPHGIYRVTGHIKRCPWGVIFDHSFHKVYGDFSDIWMSGYEITEALRAKELRIDSISGYGFEAPRATDTAFTRFVDHFYHQKAIAKNPTEKHFFKLILNSLYGKFIARTKDMDGNHIAGSMFDPTIASLITGFVRAKVHRLEHKYDSIHTATDGFITRKRPDPSDLGENLGALKVGNFGPCIILRNKLYLHYDEQGTLQKKGLHGFQGTAEDLERLWKSSNREYKVGRLTRWGEAWHTGIAPGIMVTGKRTLHL